SRDDLKPTAKLTEAMYRSLQQEFQSDKVAKTKADQIEIPKGSSAERRKRDEEEIVFRKEKEEAKVEKQPEVSVTPAPVTVEEKPTPVEVPPPPQPEVIKIDVPEIEGPKTVGKIDLESIDSSTRPKKGAKKKEKEIQEV